MLSASEIVLIPYPFTDVSAEKRRPVMVYLPRFQTIIA
jgi:hypothetical protein